MAIQFNKINMFTHIAPDKYKTALCRKAQRSQFFEDLETHYNGMPTIFDMDLRFRMLDKYEGLREVVTLMSPPLEMVATPKDAVELAKLANEEIAEMMVKYPDHFIAGVAALPMNDMDSALREAERAIEKLNLKGVQIFTPCGDKPLDSPEFLPLYEMMARYDLPIWLHPTRDVDTPDYKSESRSKYRMFQTIGWPYESTMAMIRLVFGGVLERYPTLKIITHHCGGMVPYFAGRLCGEAQQQLDHIGSVDVRLSRPKMEYFKMFYADTALSGDSTPALMCGFAFFGAEHVVFGTDLLFGIDKKISSVEQMTIPDEAKYQIFEGNARKLLRIEG